MNRKLSLSLCLLLLLAMLPGAAFAQTQLPAASIVITAPEINAAVPLGFVTVTGTGTGLPENNVVVQALDDAGVLLGQAVATVNAELGGSGPWEASVEVRAAPGTVGSIYAFSTSPADGSTVAEASIPVTFGEAPAPVPASITIGIPIPNEVVSTVEVVAQGTGSGLPENNVVVRALDAAGGILVEQATTVNADLGGSGDWQVVLTLGAVEPGSQGSIYAFSTSPADGSTIAEASVAVQYGTEALPTPTNTPEPTLEPTAEPTVEPTATPGPVPTATAVPQQPLVRIFSPAEGAVVNTEDGNVTVSGVAQNVFENNVVVSIAAGGAPLAQAPTTADQNGNWSITLQTGSLNVPGTIRAYSTSPVHGGIVAQDLVNVIFQAPAIPPPQPPNIVIDSPADGSTAETGGGLFISGQAVNIFENNVIVRVRDGFGQTIRQTATTADLNGNWSVGFDLLIANGSTGSIYAFSTSPADGRVMAEDLVNVVFASNCTVRTDWPVYTVQRGDTLFSIAQRTGSTVEALVLANCLPSPNTIRLGQRLHVPRLPDEIVESIDPELLIAAPEADTELARNAPFFVEGRAVGLPLGDVFVRALDSDGHVIDAGRVDVTHEGESDDRWLWETQLVAPNVPPGTRGTLFAYSLSLADGEILASDAREVVYGEDGGQPYLLITEPQPYSTVDGSEVVVSGRGRGLFEGNVVVQVLDGAGRVLLQEPTTMSTDEPGGEGEWTITLPLDYVGRGQIVAFSPSPADGSWSASAAVDVLFGDVTDEASFVQITHPLPNRIYSNESRFFVAAGYAGGVFVENVFVLVVDSYGEIVFSAPVSVDPQTGFWSLIAQPEAMIDEDQEYTIHAVAMSPVDGAVLARDRISVSTRAKSQTVSGSIVYRERIALPEDAVVKVRISNASLADAPPEETLLAEQIINSPGQVPIAYAVPYNPADVQENLLYSIGARVEDSAGNLLFISTQAIPVITQNNPTEDVEILVVTP